MSEPRPRADYMVTVCSACRCASCWHGVFFCDRSATAGTAEVRASELRTERREHRSYFGVARLREVCGGVRYIESKGEPS